MLAYVTIKFLRVLKISQILPDFSRFFKISKVSFLKFLNIHHFPMVSLLTEGGGIVTPDVDDPQSAEHGPDSDGESLDGIIQKACRWENDLEINE